MSKIELLQLSNEELVDLIEVYSKLYAALDGLWFLSVEEEYGHDVATKLDVKVWESLVPREAERIGNVRKIAGGGIEAVIEAFKLRPTFLTKEYKVIREKNRAIVRVTKCRSLDAMERDKREVSSCIRVLGSVYPMFVKSIDSRARFRVLKAPPRKSAGDTCCEWEIEIP
ncbi:hypothetical protein ES703_65620 [subsurface metagenome]